jgi:hypothetical protein
MFPPQKKNPGIGIGPPGRGQQDGDPMGGGSPAGLPFGPGPGGLPPQMSASRTKPGQGMDPFEAMMQGLGPDVLGGLGGPQQGPASLAPMGGNGLPFGGSMPRPGGPDDGQDMGGSDLLKALMGSIGGGDPYATGPMPTNLNVGSQDPQMGLEQMLQMLALSQMGVGGQPGAGGSGVPFDPAGGMGQMTGF